MSSNPLIINKAKELYLKHGGQNHREIEREMRSRLGCLTFTRRVFHGQQTRRGYRKGWIELYGWKQELTQLQDQSRCATGAEQAETRVSASVFYHPQPESEFKQDGQDNKESAKKTTNATPYPADPVHPVKTPPPRLGVSAVDSFCDPLNRKPGEALCPERFTREDLERIKRKLGSYSFSALYQQRPLHPKADCSREPGSPE